MAIALDGTGRAGIATGVGFLDHMLELFARHALFDRGRRGWGCRSWSGYENAVGLPC
jgi:hypothetical protein